MSEKFTLTEEGLKNLQDELINENDVYGFDIHVIDNYAEDVRIISIKKC